jgi:hypothetical protein
MLDFDLAQMYGVKVKALNQAVKRNIERFPDDFMFQLTKGEWEILRSQIVISNSADNQTDNALRSQIVTLKNGRGEHKKYMPYAFTEQGVAMLSSVLRSPLAIQVNIGIMRAFVTMRHALTAVTLPAKVEELERGIEDLRRRVDAIMVNQDEALADQNDINESTRAQLDAISTALVELQSNGTSDKPRRRIGFVQD